MVIVIYLGNSHGGIHFQWSCRSAVLVGMGSFVGVSQLFYLSNVCTNAFWGIALSDYFIVLSTLFILTYMEGKLRRECSLRVDF